MNDDEFRNYTYRSILEVLPSYGMHNVERIFYLTVLWHVKIRHNYK